MILWRPFRDIYFLGRSNGHFPNHVWIRGWIIIFVTELAVSSADVAVGFSVVEIQGSGLFAGASEGAGFWVEGGRGKLGSLAGSDLENGVFEVDSPLNQYLELGISRLMHESIFWQPQ